jgi:propionyl-CoA carboxylase alpha chain
VSRPVTTAPISPIRRLLVANRGEIAARVMRTAHEMDIATVAVFSDADADAPFVALADQAVRLPGVTPADTYLRGDLVIEAALRTRADAVHPGYGFLSEHAGFARACAEAGVVFVGPPPDAIEAMGSKTAAKRLMQRAGVPVLPGLVVDADGTVAGVPLVEAAKELDLPLLVKAAFGGGGRGMRIVPDLDDLAAAVDGAQREAASAFGDGTVFLEHYVERPRHIEVQVFADAFGSTVHLFERECSIQRRYQKIIEEAPSPAVGEELREELGTAAVDAARAIGYVGAGTVEFVLDPSGAFFFLEMNTRLQVEHPVTEMVTGTDLVRAQLVVAEGGALPEEVRDARITGHAIEARLYAEDVPAGYLPATGTLDVFEVPGLDGVRVDSGVRSGSVVGVSYDPLLAKVVAHGATRDQAVRRLARALSQTQVLGVTTNRALLVSILREQAFRAGEIDTGYLDRHDVVAMSRPAPEDVRTAHLVAAALAGAHRRRATAALLPDLPSGWRNVPNQPQWADYDVDGTTVRVGYRITGQRALVEVDGVEHEVGMHGVHGDCIELTIDGVRAGARVRPGSGGATHVVSAAGVTTLHEAPRFTEPGATAPTGSLLAPMPGTVVRVEVEAGRPVVEGAVVLVLEAMKMEHTVRAPYDGIVESIDVHAGQTVDSGAVVAVITTREDQ